MAVQSESELLNKLRSGSTSTPPHHAPIGSDGPTGGEDAAKRAHALLMQVRERGSLADRRIASRQAVRTWRTLPQSLQDKHVCLLTGLWEVYLFQGRQYFVRRMGIHLVRVGTLTERPALRAEGLLALGVLELSHGNSAASIKYLELSKATFLSSEHNQRDVIRASIPLASAYRLIGDGPSGKSLLLRARKLCLEIEDVSLLTAISQNLGSIYVDNGDLPAANECYSFVQASSEFLNSRKGMLHGNLGLAIVHNRLGRPDEAVRYAQTALRESEDFGMLRACSQSCEYLADALAQLGKFEASLRYYRDALRIARRLHRTSEHSLEVHRRIAELWIGLRVARKARYHLQCALVDSALVCEAEDSLALERISAGLIWLENGRSAESIRRLVAHHDGAKLRGLGYERLLGAYQISLIAQESGDDALSAEWWSRTEFLAESCGALPLLERWRKERQERGWLPTDAAAMQAGPSDANHTDEQTEPPLSPVSLDLPRVDLAEHGIITRSRRLEEQAAWIAKVAASGVPVLIRGQSGTGKELFARLVHTVSGRKDGPFLAINCGALPAEIIESELFGHRRGAFTGAIFDKPGLFREAHEGTLFLDEIGEMPPSAQAKLLRVVETGEFRPVGGTRYERADVRIVAATNADLDKGVRDGKFRKDLYFRLRGLEIFLPPLRDRLSDIAPLAHYFLERLNRSYGRKQKLGFDTVQWLMGQQWPGNIRELRLAMERASALAPSEADLQPEHFIGLSGATESSSLPEELEEIERARVLNALEASDWNTSGAARLLGMSRTTLTGRIKKLGIEKPRTR